MRKPSPASRPASPPAVAAIDQACLAFLWACRLDVATRKPGNVSVVSPGHDMMAQQFVDSAIASVPGLFAPGAGVGARVLAAVEATRAVAGCNTNLGILLLCAPLARALELRGAGPLDALRAALDEVLAALDLEDARAACAAIALAGPGGLGRVAEQDVAGEVTVNLRAAMALAAERDLIARQYANGFAEVLAALERHFPDRAGVAAVGDAQVQLLFLDLLARHADSHIMRKHGEAAARAVQTQAQAWHSRLQANARAAEGAEFAAWDETLKARGLNPGTTADFTVAVLFLAAALGRVSCAPAAGEH